MAETISYTPPPILKGFIKEYLPGELFYNWVIGPIGSGKTTAIFFKLAYMAGLQAPQADGIRRTRAVIVRNTFPQLRDTTIKSWFEWFKDGQAGKWRATDKDFLLKFNDVECEVMFRALDTPDDINRVLSMEVTFAILDEFVHIPLGIMDALSGRCGRYPARKAGGPTNWGMWGSSNPSTEDNPWFEYLFNELPENARYFKQPSGFSPDAENIEHLPGGKEYYTNQAKGKSEPWVKQFIESEWGFSAAGKAVIGTFNPDMHIARTPLQYDKTQPLVVGFDPGLGGSAFIFGQEDLHGRLKVYGELVQEGYGARRLIEERLRPYLRRRFPEARIIIAPDPAASNRGQRDEKTIVDELRRHYQVKVETNNRLAQRLTSIEHYTTRLTDVGPAFLVDAVECPVLVRALKGGWRFELNKKTGDMKSPDPEKNAYSHPGDALGYLARYYVRQTERSERYARMKLPTPQIPANQYHFR
ncbi:hypothetical protein [Candidatus Macondimonas diazotrophica]|uniref:Terminase n=1 Tax=Candidatus Macondimonas diazotrophica TaxID=2305248 RepID=A0A4Z0F5T6_9GAMM|nr:hypothetical protein [Candidatus Macondimonas diazotrophica]TFZ81322.1 hypothetical protein E4680_12935 [Candidatus Macondimonas diazotrophica]